MLDIVFCSLPYSSLDQIYSAPAILKGVVNEHGFSARTKDFGCDLLKLCNKDSKLFYQAQNYFILPDTTHKELIDRFYDLIIDYFEQHPSKYIGLSVFSVWTHKATYEIVKRIKQRGITSKIVVGGRGANVVTYSPIQCDIEISPREKILRFGELLLKQGLADHAVYGDGEQEILDILNNVSVVYNDSNIDHFKSSHPNYSDYNFDEYLFDGTEIQLPITGSKGCVRACDFCNVEHHFGKFKFRSGADVANEMIDSSNRYGIRKFQFTDSLVNGGLKPFEEFLRVLSAYNLANPDKRIIWNGQYICRPSNQMPAHLYQLMADAGAEGLTVGAESGSDHVLAVMNKKTTVKALFDELEQFRKHNLTCLLLTFVGHWSETWEDFEQHCKMLINLLPYIRSGTISAVKLGDIFIMLDGTPALNNAEKNQIKISDFNKSHIWAVENNQSNTFKERIYRRLIVDKLAAVLKIPTVNDTETLAYINSIVDTQHTQINKFYESVF